METALVWLRRDLRLADQPALARALDTCERVVPVYIHAPEESGDWADGAASRWWLHHSLARLGRDLAARGSRLVIRRGKSLPTLRALAAESGATRVYWTRQYEPAPVARDRDVKAALREDGLEVASVNGALLFEPWQQVKDDGSPYKVFTPFWKACERAGIPGEAGRAPQALPPVPQGLSGDALEELGLLPRVPWDAGLAERWEPGEAGAEARLAAFLEEAMADYGEARNRPDLPGTARLSPHLHFGEIGPRQAVAAVREALDRCWNGKLARGAEAWIRELGWREFSYHLLYHFPHTPDRPLDERFEDFPWAQDYGETLKAWQRGRTGIPIVDAAMRELWATGWMHNRVRMVVASLLTKNLLIPWQEGARWFWDTLVDADLANNTQGWQWTAGCGADAAPFFRIFNPVLQGEKFDPEGAYVRRWVPELARLPDGHLQKPWEAPETELAAAGLRLGRDYPRPIVDLKGSRARALERFERIKKEAVVSRGRR